jgi:hypothetical protein
MKPFLCYSAVREYCYSLLIAKNIRESATEIGTLYVTVQKGRAATPTTKQPRNQHTNHVGFIDVVLGLEKCLALESVVNSTKPEYRSFAKPDCSLLAEAGSIKCRCGDRRATLPRSIYAEYYVMTFGTFHNNIPYGF